MANKEFEANYDFAWSATDQEQRMVKRIAFAAVLIVLTLGLILYFN